MLVDETTAKPWPRDMSFAFSMRSPLAIKDRAFFPLSTSLREIRTSTPGQQRVYYCVERDWLIIIACKIPSAW